MLGSDSSTLVNFLLHSASFTEIILLTSTFGQDIINTVMYLTRTWVFAVHRMKQRMLGRWPDSAGPRETLDKTFPDNDIDKTASVPINYQTNTSPITGTTTHDGTMSHIATVQLHIQDQPQVPVPACFDAVMPSPQPEVLGQSLQGGQLVLSHVAQFFKDSCLNTLSTYETFPKPQVSINQHI